MIQKSPNKIPASVIWQGQEETMFKKILKNFKGNYRPTKMALLIIKFGLSLSCLLLAASLLVGVYAGELTSRTYELHYLYSELYRTPLGILLLSSLGALIINELEDHQ